MGFLIGFLFPALSLFATFLIMASSSVFPTLIGTRMGLQTKGMQARTKFWGLFLPAVIYGAVEGVSITLILGLMMAFSLVVISPDILQQNQFTNLASQYLDISWATPAVLGLIAVFLSVCSIRASLLVPITSASIGRDPDGLPYTPFRHFRASFGPLFALTIFSYVGMIILHAALIMLIVPTGIAQMLQADLAELGNMTTGAGPIRPIWSLIVLLIVYMLIGTWAFSLQCAGGVLGYLKLKEDASASHPAAPSGPEKQPTPADANSGPKLSQDDLRALRKSRQMGSL